METFERTLQDDEEKFVCGCDATDDAVARCRREIEPLLNLGPQDCASSQRAKIFCLRDLNKRLKKKISQCVTA